MPEEFLRITNPHDGTSSGVKTLPGLPVLPTGHWWEVRPSTTGEYYFVELKANTNVVEINRTSLFSHTLLASRRTRSWPRPSVRTIVRVAHEVHRQWLKEKDRKEQPFVGKLVGR